MLLGGPVFSWRYWSCFGLALTGLPARHRLPQQIRLQPRAGVPASRCRADRGPALGCRRYTEFLFHGLHPHINLRFRRTAVLSRAISSHAGYSGPAVLERGLGRQQPEGARATSSRTAKCFAAAYAAIPTRYCSVNLAVGRCHFTGGWHRPETVGSIRGTAERFTSLRHSAPGDYGNWISPSNGPRLGRYQSSEPNVVG